MEEHPLESYPLALLSLMGTQEGAVENPPLGTARRAGATSSTFDVPAHKLLHALIQHSPSPTTIAQEFLVKLGKIPAIENTVDTLRSNRSVSPNDWATVVHAELERNDGNIRNLTDLASYYYSNLIIAFVRNPGEDTTPPTPNLKRLEEIEALLQSATVHGSQLALRDLIFLRDGNRCPITNYPFYGTPRVVPARCVHIIPFSIHSKTHVHQAIETFTGHILTADVVHHFINHPANAMNIHRNERNSMDLALAWGIEAREVDHKLHYYFRVVRPNLVPYTTPLEDGDEIQFGKGDAGNTIQLPDPRICNLHLAIARVFAASGAADVFDKYLEDYMEWADDISQVPVYFGGPFVADDVLMRRLEVSVLDIGNVSPYAGRLETSY